MLDLQGVSDCPNDFQTAAARCRQRRTSGARQVRTTAVSRGARSGVLHIDLNSLIFVEGDRCRDRIFPVPNRVCNKLPKYQFVDGEVSSSVAFGEQCAKLATSRTGSPIVLFLEPPPFGHAELFPRIATSQTPAPDTILHVTA